MSFFVRVGLFVIIAWASVVPHVSLAQNGAGIGLKPATIEETLEPGVTKQYNVSISNVSGSDQVYYLSKRDISGVKDGGVPIFADEAIEKTPYEISEWMVLAVDTLAVPKGEERTLSFILNVPADAAPGSHFGGIFVSAEPPRLRESGAAVGYEVANIISIRVAGEVLEKAQIRQFSTDNYLYGKPEVNFSARIENSGNTLLRPTGPLEITNMFGKQVANLNFNQELAGVFPGNTREFTLSWKEGGPMFGRYEAILSPVYGEDGFKQTVSSSVTFWILPMNIIGPALGVLVFLLLVTYISVRLYIKRKLLNYSGVGGTRKLVRRRQNNSSAFLLIFVVMMTVTALFLLVLLAFFA